MVDAAYEPAAEGDDLGSAPLGGWDVPPGIDPVPDVTGDGRPDVLIASEASADGAAGVGTTWILDAFSPGAHSIRVLSGLPSEPWPDSHDVRMALAGTGDFDGDGERDVFLRHDPDLTEDFRFEGYLFRGPLVPGDHLAARRTRVTAAADRAAPGAFVVGDGNGDGRDAIALRILPDYSFVSTVWLADGCNPQ